MPSLLNIYKILYSAFGPQYWWPAESSFEVIIGAILTQNAAWKNVEYAIRNLKQADLLHISKIADTESETLERLIRPAGFYKQKAERIKSISYYILHKHKTLERFLSQDIQKLRKELLDLKGIGPETADSIILYAANKPTFIIDAYTRRIYNRIFGTNIKDYYKLQKTFESELPRDVRLYQEYHALLVELAKKYCRKKPQCTHCPLNGDCTRGRNYFSSNIL